MIKSVRKRFTVLSAFFQIFLVISMSFIIAFFLNDNLASGQQISLLPTATDSLKFKDVDFSLGGASGSSGGGGSGLGNLPKTNTESGDLMGSVKEIYTGKGWTSEALGPWGGSLVAGAAWALTAYVAVKFIGDMIGLEEGAQKALEKAVTTGAFVSGTLNGMVNNGLGQSLGWFGRHPYASGLIVTAVIFVLTYKDTSKEMVNYQCLPYEAPIGGQKCEECNKDIFRPCTEYRCKSLGQACELLNPGTSEAQCAWVGRNDVNSPVMVLNSDSLKPIGLKYNPDNALRPGSLGTKIVNSNSGCLSAFTPLEFGFNTNEPAQCKVDFNHTNKFDVMSYFVGDTNFYLYNHTQKMRLPGPTNESEIGFPLLRNDGNFALYVRCRDKNGNENVDEFSFAFCVDETDDTTPPVIEDFSLPSGSYVTFNNDVIPIETYINEPSECKWSIDDKAYEDMENSMHCDTSPRNVNANLQYTCKGNLTGVKDMEDNTFYFRCKDQPSKLESERNVNLDSKILVLKGSQQLSIVNIMPNETVTGSTDAVKVELKAETYAGAETGKAQCFFSDTGISSSYIPMFETNNFIHKQTLTLPKGNYTYFVRCIDSGGNAAENSTNFEVFSDRDPPGVTRLYKQQDAIKLVTDEDAQCVFSLSSCSYNFDDAMKSTENVMIYSEPDVEYNLYAPWKAGVTYYIKCRDKYGNEPSPNMCSVVASPIQLNK